MPDVLRKTLESKSKKIIFVGYDKKSKNYRLFDPITKAIKVGRNVIFNEKNCKLSIPPPPSTFLFTIDNDDMIKDSMNKNPDNLCKNHPNSQNHDHNDLRPRDTLTVPARYELNVANIVKPQTYD